MWRTASVECPGQGGKFKPYVPFNWKPVKLFKDCSIEDSEEIRQRWCISDCAYNLTNKEMTLLKTAAAVNYSLTNTVLVIYVINSLHTQAFFLIQGLFLQPAVTKLHLATVTINTCYFVNLTCLTHVKTRHPDVSLCLKTLPQMQKKTKKQIIPKIKEF